MFRRSIAGAFILLHLLSAAPLLAAEPPPDQVEAARKLFKEATALEKERRWAEAAEKLKGALEIKETPGLRYHHAFCMAEQGRLVDALAEYRRAQGLIDAGVAAPDVDALLAPAIKDLAARIPTLTLTPAQGTPKGTVRVDEREVKDAYATPLQLDPGQHRVSVSAPGHQEFSQSLELKEGEKKSLEVTLRPSDTAAPAASTALEPTAPSQVPMDDAGSARTAVLIGEGAFTVVALGVGIGFAIKKGSDQERIDDADAVIGPGAGACLNPAPEIGNACSELDDAVSDHKLSGTLSLVGFVGAGVGAVATVATFLLWKPEDQPVGLTLRGQSGGLGLSFDGRF